MLKGCAVEKWASPSFCLSSGDLSMAMACVSRILGESRLAAEASRLSMQPPSKPKCRYSPLQTTTTGQQDLGGATFGTADSEKIEMHESGRCSLQEESIA